MATFVVFLIFICSSGLQRPPSGLYVLLTSEVAARVWYSNNLCPSTGLRPPAVGGSPIRQLLNASFNEHYITDYWIHGSVCPSLVVAHTLLGGTTRCTQCTFSTSVTRWSQKLFSFVFASSQRVLLSGFRLEPTVCVLQCRDFSPYSTLGICNLPL